MSDVEAPPAPPAPSPAGAPVERPRTTRLSTAVSGWIPLVALWCSVTYLAVRVAGRITDPDTWWHLRLGEDFTNGWSLSNPGRLSPFATRPWFATQWLFEVVASDLYDVFGLRAVAWLTGIGVLGLAWALLTVCRREGAALPASLAVVLALTGTSASLAPRPQLVSFILLAVFLGAWLRTARDLQPRWWLVPLTFVWACSHGMWFTGLVLGVAVVLGLVLDRRVTPKQSLRLLLVPALGLVAAAVTPVGPKLLLAPLELSRVASYIVEWQPPNFREPYAFVTALMLLAVVVTWSRVGRTTWSHVLLLVVAFGWTLLSGRTVALGAVMAAPLFAAAVQHWTRAGPVRPRARHERRWAVSGLALAVLLVTVLAPFRAYPDVAMSPSIERALTDLPQGTVVLNDYGLGGWLEWKHPNVATVIDGMTDAYDPGYITRYVQASLLDPGWRAFVRGTGARYALFYRSEPLAGELQHALGWRVLAIGPTTVLLVAPTGSG